MNRPRSSLARIIVVAVAVAVVPAINPSSVGAGPIDDQRQKVQQITDELERLEQQSDTLAEEYTSAVDEQRQLAADVTAAQQRVADREAEVAGLRTELSQVALASFANSGTDSLGPMFTDAAAYTSNLQRNQLSRVALSTGTATTDELDQAVSDLHDERAALDDKRAEAADLAAHVEQAKAANAQRKQEYEQARADAEAELGALIKEEEERRARESYERMQREAEEAAARQAAAQAQAQAEAQQRAAEQLAAQQQVAAQQLQQAAGAQQQAAAGQQQAEPQQQQQQQSSGSSSSSRSSATSSGSTGSTSSSGDSSSAASTSSSGSSSGSSSSGSSSSTSTSQGSNRSAIASAPAATAPPRSEPDPEPQPPAIPPASSRASIAVNAALSQLGVPWVFAAAQPGVAFDCSGLTMWAWRQAGVSLPHQSAQQYAAVPHIPQSAAQPGDLVFFYSPISHVSIYLGGGQEVHSPNSGSVVNVATVNWSRVVGVGRPG